MERANIAYLLKNILISSNQSYPKCMIEKIENRKWSYYKNALESAFFYSNNTENSDISNFNFGFKSEITSPIKRNILMHLKTTYMIWCDVLNLDVHIMYFTST